MMVMMSSLAKTDPHRCLRVQDVGSVIGDPS